MNLRSALVDTGVSSLPPARKVSPQVLTGVPSGGSQSGLLPAVASAQEVPGAGAQLRKTCLLGSWKTGGPRGPSAQSASLPSSSCLPRTAGRPGLQSYSEARPGRELPKAWARAESGADLGRTRGGEDTAVSRELPEAIHARPGSTSPLLPLSRPPRLEFRVPSAPPPPQRPGVGA